MKPAPTSIQNQRLPLRHSQVQRRIFSRNNNVTLFTSPPNPTDGHGAVDYEGACPSQHPQTVPGTRHRRCSRIFCRHIHPPRRSAVPGHSLLQNDHRRSHYDWACRGLLDQNGVQSVSGLTKRDLPLVLLSSASLSVHFWAWILSLEYTSVASSVVLVTTSPFLVAIASRVFFAEPVYKYTFVGIAVGIAGGVILAVGDAGGESEILGDLLAFAGAVAIVGYMLAGRRLRRHVPALSYNSAVYSVTAVILLIAAILAGDPFTGYTPQTYLWLAMVALVPQVIGHSLLNWSLAHVTATAVAIAVMAEPVIATAAAVIILGEAPPLTSVIGES